MTNPSNVCACAICGGTECQCGCQAAAVAARQCVDGCTCGAACTCPACHEAKSSAAERR